MVGLRASGITATSTGDGVRLRVTSIVGSGSDAAAGARLRVSQVLAAAAPEPVRPRLQVAAIVASGEAVPQLKRTLRRAPGGEWEPGWLFPGAVWRRAHPDQTWQALSSASAVTPELPGPTPEPPVTANPARFTDSNQPSVLRAGESFKDNMPAGVPVRRLSEFTLSTDFRTMMERIESQLTVPSYVEDDIGVAFTISSLRSYGASDYRGWTNQSRRMMGLIGHPSGVTRVVMQPTAVSSTPGAADHAMDIPVNDSIGVFAMYLSNTSTNVPLFWSGITFDGTLQTPYRRFTTAAQGKFRTNASALSPLPWRGIAIWRAVEGSRFQFLRLRGFSFSVNTSPPFELGPLESNYGREVYHRIEIDGRIAAEYTSSRPRVSGGLMLNKPADIRVVDSWMHHTRRSGYAMNTNSGSTDERMTTINLQTEEIANVGNDGWPMDSMQGFHGSNLEEMIGVATYRDAKLNAPASEYNIHLATPALLKNTTNPLVLPGRPIVVARNAYTDDALYGGCLRIGVSERPNSTGVSPAWTRLSQVGIAASNLFDIRDANGEPMIGIRHTEWNARQNQSGDAASFYPKSRYFVVRY